MARVTVAASDGSTGTVDITLGQGDPVPTGTFYRGDDMTQSTDWAVANVWGQYSGPGSASSQVEWRTNADGPLVDGVRRRYRRFLLDEGDRPANAPGDLDAERIEIGQVNNDDGFVYVVGGRYVTRTWHRVPTDLDFAGDESNLMQMKHSSQAGYGGSGGDPISSAPPLSLKQFSGGIKLIERSGNYNGRNVWQRSIPHMVWWEIAYDITYSFNGHIDIYWRLEGQVPALVFSGDIPTIKRNENNQPMYSTYRVGRYQSNPVQAGIHDVGPVRVERL